MIARLGAIGGVKSGTVARTSSLRVAAIQSSLGDALSVAAKVPGPAGHFLAHAARSAFASGVDLGMLTAVGVAVGGFQIAPIWLPRRAR